MKKLLLLSTLFIAFLGFVEAQVVTTTPNLPIPDASVTVFFDASLGNAELADYAGDIYAHTGVITENSSSGSDWKYVKANWDQNIAETKLTKISDNYYSLEITPSIIDYYGVPVEEDILQMAFVFRNEDGSLVGKNEDGSDIFIDVYSDPNSINFSSPDPNIIYSLNDDIQINVAALFATEITLFINDNEIQTFTGNSIDETYTITASGDNEIKIIATDGIETVKDSINIFVRLETVETELPYENLQDGINYIDETTVTLVLYAPYKDFIFVKGNFDNWEMGVDNQMFKTPIGDKFWLTIENLTAGEEYIFQYIIDGDIYIADPYADKILDPWNDQYISNSTYPDLIDYPTENADGIVSVFQTNQTPYSWEVENFTKPAPEDLIIYELHIRDFIASHDYNTLIDTLSYLKNLGINAIELMPINEFEGNNSWGYNPSFYFAPDKYYGTKTDLKQFIDECHKNDIAVILDIVLNHAYGQCPLVQMYFDPDAGNWGQPSVENPWFNETSPNPVYSWGSDFDHESEATKEFLTRVNRYWISEYKFDGFRFDFTKGFTNTGGDGWAYDASRIQILKDMADSIWHEVPETYVILEHLADNSEEKVLANYGIMLWGNTNHNYTQASMGYTSDSDFSWISYKNRAWDNPNLVGYMESHDEERIMFKNLKYGNSSGGYDIQNLETALKRVELVALFFLTIPGPKMIWQFGELGYDISIDDPCRVCDKPIKWNYYEEENRNRLYRFYSEILSLRKTYDIFNTSDFSINANGKIKEIILQGDTMDMVIIGNFDIYSAETTPSFTNTGTWNEYFSNTEIASDQTITLGAGEYKLYTSKKIESSDLQVSPIAQNVEITGDTIVGAALTGNYTFYDANGDLELGSTYQWYRADNQSGSNKTLINYAQNTTYTTKETDAKKYITFEVTPIANSNSFQQGTAISSDYFGAIFMEEEPTDGEFVIKPNPSFDEIIITQISEYDKITVTNLFGKIIYTFETNNENNFTIDLSDLKSGVYYIKITNDEKFITKKVVKI